VFDPNGLFAELSFMTKSRNLVVAAALLSAGLALSACATKPKATANATPPVADKGFLGLFKGAKKSSSEAPANIGVNAYLWRASLDTLSFMPLSSADPWGGVIITEWYANPQKPDERFKATVYILDTRLRADALSVSVYKQVQAGGQWVDTDVASQTQIDIENSILTRARELRLSDVK
jgi:hypothetical protein